MFTAQMTIAGFDPELAKAIADERNRQEDHIELIASENYTSPRVLEAQGSVLTNKYAEGYPGKRYYGGCEFVDVAESLGHRPGQAAVRRGLRQCAAAFGQPGECRRVLGPAQSRRYDSGHEPGSRRPPDAWRESQFLGQVVQGRAIRHQRRHRRDRLRPGGEPGQGTPPQDRGRRLLGLFARSSTGRVFAPSPIRWAPTSSSTWRTSRAWWPRACTRIPCPSPTS